MVHPQAPAVLQPSRCGPPTGPTGGHAGPCSSREPPETVPAVHLRRCGCVCTRMCSGRPGSPHAAHQQRHGPFPSTTRRRLQPLSAHVPNNTEASGVERRREWPLLTAQRRTGEIATSLFFFFLVWYNSISGLFPGSQMCISPLAGFAPSAKLKTAHHHSLLASRSRHDGTSDDVLHGRECEPSSHGPFPAFVC